MDWLSAVGIVGSLTISAISLWIALNERQSRIRKERAQEQVEKTKAHALAIKIVATSVVGEKRQSEPGFSFAALNNSMYPVTVTTIAGVVQSSGGDSVFRNVQVGEIKIAPARPDLGLAPRPVQIWRGEPPPIVLAPMQTYVIAITQQDFADYYLKGPTYPKTVQFSITYIAEGGLTYHCESESLPLDISLD